MDIPHLHHILVPIDFSGPSLNAMNTAISMAKRHSAKLTFLHVVDQGILSFHPADILPATAAEPGIKVRTDETKNMLSEISKSVKIEHGLEVEEQMAQGCVSSEICKTADIQSVDIIVMGSHGTSRFRQFFMGTNAYSVVKHAACPVLTVPDNNKWNSFSKILFPVRDTPNALQKYDFLRKIIYKNNAIIHVIGFPSAKIPYSKNWVSDLVTQFTSKLRFDAVDCVTQEFDPTERVAELILQVAEKIQADLIAITATLDYNLRDFFVGPFTQQIVNHAKVPVLSIRPKQRGITEPDLTGAIGFEYGTAIIGG